MPPLVLLVAGCCLLGLAVVVTSSLLSEPVPLSLSLLSSLAGLPDQTAVTVNLSPFLTYLNLSLQTQLHILTAITRQLVLHLTICMTVAGIN